MNGDFQYSTCYYIKLSVYTRNKISNWSEVLAVNCYFVLLVPKTATAKQHREGERACCVCEF